MWYSVLHPMIGRPDQNNRSRHNQRNTQMRCFSTCEAILHGVHTSNMDQENAQTHPHWLSDRTGCLLVQGRFNLSVLECPSVARPISPPSCHFEPAYLLRVCIERRRIFLISRQSFLLVPLRRAFLQPRHNTAQMPYLMVKLGEQCTDLSIPVDGPWVSTL